jgi:iron complex outermembrane receptor protein
VTVTAGATATADFVLAISPLRQEITVTASGRPETTVETFSSVASLDTLELSTKAAASLGDVLDGQPGVAKRSFGPGTGRPVLRGFDGDRVLIMQDGVRTGSLSSQSGDHGEPLDPQALERVEVVRGQATLLYGSNAIGGVVNMIAGHHEAQSAGHEGLHGYLSGIGGTNNGLHGGSAGLDYGIAGQFPGWGRAGSGLRTIAPRSSGSSIRPPGRIRVRVAWRATASAPGSTSPTTPSAGTYPGPERRGRGAS